MTEVSIAFGGGMALAAYHGGVLQACLSGGAGPAALTLAGNITEIGGPRAITKSGTCVVILTGNNNYSGGTTITVP